jgi:hypothetical protein
VHWTKNVGQKVVAGNLAGQRETYVMSQNNYVNTECNVSGFLQLQIIHAFFNGDYDPKTKYKACFSSFSLISCRFCTSV